MTDNTNNKTQSKSSIVILIAVIAVIAGVIGFGLYQNYSKTHTNTPDEITTTQIPTTEEQTTQDVTTVAPTTAEPTTEKPTEKPTTASKTTKPPATEPPTETVTVVQNNPSVYDLYGYYVNEGYYIKITYDEYESKSCSNGYIIAQEKISNIESIPLDDGKTRFFLSFENEGYDYIRNLIMDSNKNLYAVADGALLKRISKEEYDNKVFENN